MTTPAFAKAKTRPIYCKEKKSSVTDFIYNISTLSSSSASSLTAGLTTTEPITKLSVGVLQRVPPPGEDGWLLSSCRCKGRAENERSAGLSSDLTSSSDPTA